MIKAVVFDVGGVLLTGADWQGGISRWEQRLRLADGTLERAWREIDTQLGADMVIGKATPEQFRDLHAARIGVSSDQLSELIEDVTSTEIFDPDWKEFIGGLRPRYKTATLTNAWLNMRETLTKRGVAAVMDELFISAELGMAKPQPEVFEHVLDSLGLEPEEIAFVDDLEPNIDAAGALGIVTVLHQNTRESIASLEKLLD
jgi:epoxide hydrolase-like predicted phosphatase